MPAFGSGLFLDVFASVLEFSVILVTLCYLQVPKDVSVLCSKVHGKNML